MALSLQLGVIDIPYSTPPAASGKEAKPVSVTTGDVANFIETKYHLFEHFYEFSADKIAEAVAESLAGSLESLAMGAPVDTLVPFAAAEGAIDAEFRQFLTMDTMATLGYPGVPTQAALNGVNHRLKQKRGAPRANFIDTGTMFSTLKSTFVQS